MLAAVARVAGIAWAKDTKRALQDAHCVRVTGLPPRSAAPITENAWLEYLYRDKVRRQTVTLTILRKRRRKKLRMRAP